MPPKRVKGRYEIKSKIGEGGMGVVYRAYDPPPMNRDVALKTLHPFPDPHVPELFYRECEVLRAISHPNIVEIFDMGEFEEGGAKMPFFVMPLLVGRPLDELIRNSKHRLTLARVIDIISQACRGLQAAHERGLVHRDMKPSNVFVMDDDSVKIIDFGVVHEVDARTRSNGFQKGTLLYMAPEQVQFKPVTPQSDIFSLGVVCYEALTRRQPFRGAREQDVIDAILNEIPPPVSEINPTVSQTISRVVHRAMAKQPWHRFSSARELSDVLQRAFRNEPIELFDPARIRPRLQRAQKAFENGDYQFAHEIVSELEAEGNIDSSMTLLKANIEQAMRQKTISQLLESAKARFEEDEDPLALQKIQQILDLDASHAAALGLKSKIENRRSERQIDSWIRLAEQHAANHAYGHAREALESVLRIRPMDARASKLLVEVETTEQEYLKLRAEKAQIYQNALNHWKNGEVSEALSQMGLVLELDRRAPDTSSAEGGQTYQSFYNTVRSEHDALNSAYAEARNAIAQEDLEKALAACNVYLTKYPSNALFQALKFDIEEQSRQRLSAYIAQVDRQLEAEPDLETKVDLLQGALARYPGESHFERSLKLVTDKRDLVNSIVLRARQHEERGQLNEALGDLEILRTIYSLYPGLAFEIERLEKKKEQRAREAAKTDWIKRIDRSLEMGEYSVSFELVAKAQQEFAGDSELAELKKLISAKRDRAEQIERLVAAGRDLCAQGSFDEGLMSLRKALDLDERNSAARNTLVEALVEAAQLAIADDWRRAESLVQKALDLDPFHTLAKHLRSRISDRRTDEEVGQIVSLARQLQGGGDLDGAMAEVKKGLSRYPSEARIVALRETLEREIAQTGRRRARLSDLEEVNNLSLRAAAAATNELGFHESRPSAALGYSDETEFQSLAAEVDRIAKDRAAVKPRKLERPRFEFEALLRMPASVPRPILWAAGVVVLLGLIFLIAHSRRSKPKPPPPMALVPVQFQVSPRKAAIRIDGKIRDTSQPVSLPGGRYQVEASLDGYESAGTTIGVTPESAPPVVNLTLRPIAQSFRITTPDLEDAEVYLDDRPLGKLEGGTLSNASVDPGRHNIRIRVLKARTEASFSFESGPGRAPRVELPLEASRSELLVIASKGGLGSIAGTMSSVPVKLDGEALGALNPDGLELTNLEPGIHTVILGEGDQARTMSFESGPSPQLDAVVYSDRNVGSVLVQVGEDNADVYVDGLKYRHATQGGELRIPNLEVRKHTIRVSKPGFRDADEQTVTVAKGQEAKLKFSLQALPKLASLDISQLPNDTRVEIDQQAPGAVALNGEFSRFDIAPGAHTIDLYASGFEPQHVSRTFAAGEEVRLSGQDLAFERPKATLEIAAAADTGVTVQRGNRTIKQSEGPTRLALEAGEYQITAHGPGGVDTFTTVTLAAGETRKIDLVSQKSGMELWPEGWTWNSGWFTHRGGGVVLYGQPQLTGTVQFTAKLHRNRNPLAPSPRLRWVVNFLDDHNYLLFQIDSRYFYRTEMIDGTSVALPKIAHHIPEHTAFVNLQIAVQPGLVEHRWSVNGDDWKVLDDLARRASPSVLAGKAQHFNEGRFGFFEPGDNDEVEISNFAYYPGRK